MEINIVQSIFPFTGGRCESLLAKQLRGEALYITCGQEFASDKESHPVAYLLHLVEMM